MLLAALLLASGLRLTVSPKVAIGPTDVTIEVFIPGEAEQLLLVATCDDGGEVVRSEIPLGAGASPIVRRVWRQVAPCPDLSDEDHPEEAPEGSSVTVSAFLLRPDGSVEHATRRVVLHPVP